MQRSLRRTAGFGSVLLLLLLLCCKRKEPSTDTLGPSPLPAPAPAPQSADTCGARGTWLIKCPRIKTDDACNIRSIAAFESRHTVSQSIAESGGTWTQGDNKYTFDRATCVLSGFTSGMPCRDLHFEANLRTGRASNVYGCWDGAKKCQATWKSPADHCSVTRD